MVKALAATQGEGPPTAEVEVSAAIQGDSPPAAQVGVPASAPGGRLQCPHNCSRSQSSGGYASQSTLEAHVQKYHSVEA